MKTYNITISATVTKIITVSAETRQDAVEQAHEEFTVVCDGDEDYNEETLNVEELP